MNKIKLEARNKEYIKKLENRLKYHWTILAVYTLFTTLEQLHWKIVNSIY